MRFTFRFVLVTLLFSTSLAAQRFPLQSEAEEIVRKASGDWGVMAWSITKSEPLFVIEGNQALIPASNNKVFTAIWALDVLGPEYRFPTDLLLRGEIRKGVLHGDVILRGSGDPGFGYPDLEEDPMRPLRRMAARLHQLGIRRVQGSVIADATVFDSMRVGPAWPDDTGGGSARYAPSVSGLPFQRNLVWVVASPRPGGGPAEVRLEPAVSSIPLRTTITSGGGRGWAARAPGSDTIQVKGSVSRRGRYGVGVRVPALLTAGALEAALREAGIPVQRGVRLGDTPAGSRLVHRHFSIPLSAMIPRLNRDSDNFFAEHLWKATVAKAVGEGSYARGGVASAIHFRARAGVPEGQLYQADGSGLSSQNRASANALVRALIYADGAPWSRVFHESLAVAARSDGSMSRLFRGSPAAGNLHGKTGYIRRVRTLSGYVKARNGELIAFSFLYNGNNTGGARGVQQELGTLLANYGGR